jgi:flagellar basal body-associated protein FliL
MKYLRTDNKSTRPAQSWIIWLIILLLIVSILVVAVSTYFNIATNSANNTKNTTGSDDNALLQSSCISQAQIEDDNNPDYQPVAGGEYGVNAIRAEHKATDMQSKITDCKTKYPTNS